MESFQSLLNQTSLSLNAADMFIDGLTADALVYCNSTSHLASANTISPLIFSSGSLSLDTAALFASITTDIIPEGKTNLYFTNTRARSALSYSGNASFTYNNTSGAMSLSSTPSFTSLSLPSAFAHLTISGADSGNNATDGVLILTGTHVRGPGLSLKYINCAPYLYGNCTGTGAAYGAYYNSRIGNVGGGYYTHSSQIYIDAGSVSSGDARGATNTYGLYAASPSYGTNRAGIYTDSLFVGTAVDSTNTTGTIKGGNLTLSGLAAGGMVKSTAGLLSIASASSDYQAFITAGTTLQYWRGDKNWATLNTAAVPESGNLYYTDTRARAAISGTLPISVSSGVVSIAHNTTNLKITSSQLNTIQDIATSSAPTFSGLTLSGLSTGIVLSTAGVLSSTTGRYAESGGTSLAVGSSALISGMGTGNTAIGIGALDSNTTGTNHTAIGYQALQSMINQTCSTAIGYRAAYNTTGEHNVGIGNEALYNCTTGFWNVGIGSNAGRALAGGQRNVAVGINSMYYNIGGSRNVAVGQEAMFNSTSGDYNTMLGMAAGYSNISGSSNVFLGYAAGYTETTSNKLHIANTWNQTLIYGDFSAGTVRINSALGVGMAPTNALDVTGLATFSTGIRVGGGSNTLAVYKEVLGATTTATYSGTTATLTYDYVIIGKTVYLTFRQFLQTFTVGSTITFNVASEIAPPTTAVVSSMVVYSNGTWMGGSCGVPVGGVNCVMRYGSPLGNFPIAASTGIFANSSISYNLL